MTNPQPWKPTLHDALLAVRGDEWRGQTWSGLKLSRIVAYALGHGDATSRRAFEQYGPGLEKPGGKGPGWNPEHLTEHVIGAATIIPRRVGQDGKADPIQWGRQVGRQPSGRAFATIWLPDGPQFKAARKDSDEARALADAALQACIWDAEQAMTRSGRDAA